MQIVDCAVAATHRAMMQQKDAKYAAGIVLRRQGTVAKTNDHRRRILQNGTLPGIFNDKRSLSDIYSLSKTASVFLKIFKGKTDEIWHGIC